MFLVCVLFSADFLVHTQVLLVLTVVDVESVPGTLWLSLLLASGFQYYFIEDSPFSVQNLGLGVFSNGIFESVVEKNLLHLS